MPITDTAPKPLSANILICFLFFAVNLSANIPTIDSLKTILRQTNQAQNEYVDLCNELTYYYYTLNIDSSQFYADLAQKLALRPPIYLKGLNDYQVRQGGILETKGAYEEALIYYEKALPFRLQLKDPIPTANLYNNIGLCHYYLDNNETAIEYYQRGLDRIAPLPASNTRANLLEQIAETYSFTGEYTQAYHYLERSAEVWEKLNDPEGRAGNHNARGNLNLELEDLTEAKSNFKTALNLYDSLQNFEGMSTAYIGLGNVDFNYNQYDKALVNYKKAAKFSDAMRSDNLNYLHFNMGVIYQQTNKLEKALENFQLCQTYFTETEDSCNLASTFTEIGITYSLQNDFQKAESYLSRSLIYCPNERDLSEKSLNHKQLALVFERLKNTPAALKHQQLYDKLRDSIYNSQKLAYNYQIDLKETYLNLEKAKNELAAQRLKTESDQLKRIGLSIAFLLFSIIGLLAFYLDRQKKKRRISEYKTSQAYLEIDDLLLTKELEITHARLAAKDETQQQIGQDLHDRLGMMLSTIKLYFTEFSTHLNELKTDTSQNQFKAIELLDEAVVEVRRISQDIQSGVLKDFGLVSAIKDLANTIEQSNQLKVQVNSHGLKQRIPNQIENKIYKIIQELISNVLKHSKAKQLTIYLHQHPESLNLIVEDDGVGFNEAAVMTKGGMGLKNIRSRVENLNGECHFDSSIDKGTSVIIDIPVKNNLI